MAPPTGAQPVPFLQPNYSFYASTALTPEEAQVGQELDRIQWWIDQYETNPFIKNSLAYTIGRKNLDAQHADAMRRFVAIRMASMGRQRAIDAVTGAAPVVPRSADPTRLPSPITPMDGQQLRGGLERPLPPGDAAPPGASLRAEEGSSAAAVGAIRRRYGAQIKAIEDAGRARHNTYTPEQRKAIFRHLHPSVQPDVPVPLTAQAPAPATGGTVPTETQRRRWAPTAHKTQFIPPPADTPSAVFPGISQILTAGPDTPLAGVPAVAGKLGAMARRRSRKEVAKILSDLATAGEKTLERKRRERRRLIGETPIDPGQRGRI